MVGTPRREIASCRDRMDGLGMTKGEPAMAEVSSDERVCVIGAGLAGSECALQLALRGIPVTLVEQRPVHSSPAHHTDRFAELVCSNSLKATRAESAAGLLKVELDAMGCRLLDIARAARSPSTATPSRRPSPTPSRTSRSSMSSGGRRPPSPRGGSSLPLARSARTTSSRPSPTSSGENTSPSLMPPRPSSRRTPSTGR